MARNELSKVPQSVVDELDLALFGAPDASSAHLDLVDRYLRPPNAAFLVLGAGSGRLVATLLRRDYPQVHVADEPKALLRLRESHPNAVHGGSLALHPFAPVEIDLRERFSAIVWLSADLSPVARGERPALLHRLARHLRPHGSVLLDLPAPGTVSGNPPSDDRASARAPAPAPAHGVPEITRDALLGGFPVVLPRRYKTPGGKRRTLFILRR